MSKFLTYSKVINGEYVTVQVEESGLTTLDIDRSRGRDRHEKYIAPYQTRELFAQFERSGWAHTPHAGASLVSLGAGLTGSKTVTRGVDTFFMSEEMRAYVDAFDRIETEMREEMGWRQAKRRFHGESENIDDDIDLGWLVAPTIGAVGIIVAQVVLFFLLVVLGLGAFSATENFMVLIPVVLAGVVGGLATYVGAGIGIGYWCRVDPVHKGMAAALIVGFLNIMSSLWMGHFGIGTILGVSVIVALTRAGVTGGIRLRERT